MKMPTITDDGRRDAGHLVFDIEPDLCREHVIVAQDADYYLPGTVLKDDGAGKAIRWDGTGDVLGLLYAGIDASAGDVRGVASVRLTVYAIPLLDWASGVTDAQKLAGMDAMKSAHLIGRPAF